VLYQATLAMTHIDFVLGSYGCIIVTYMYLTLTQAHAIFPTSQPHNLHFAMSRRPIRLVFLLQPILACLQTDFYEIEDSSLLLHIRDTIKRRAPSKNKQQSLPFAMST
jgi:hypothetical protein